VGAAQLRLTLAACTELLGERDERLGELEADVHDVKALYRDQIEFMVERLALLEAAEQRRLAAENTLPVSMPSPSFQDDNT
jgi:TATA element modulatory factor 1 TATA binding